MYHQDWIIRQISSFIQMVGIVLFKKDNIQINIYDESNSAKIHLLYERLIELINQLKINEAEDLLFESIDASDLNYVKIALDFYDRLNKLSDGELEIADFNREEIKSGIDDVLKLYNISLNLFME